jgi:hypothetical protein
MAVKKQKDALYLVRGINPELLLKGTTKKSGKQEFN